MNKDGSIYHLALKPGEVSDTIITVGDPERVEKVSGLFDSVDIKRERREFVTHTGMISNRRVSVISTGIGTDNIDIVFNELHALKNMANDSSPYKFIRLGTSGAVRPDQDINSILISKAALGFDGLLHFYDYSRGEEELNDMLKNTPEMKRLPRPYVAMGGGELIEYFTKMADAMGVTVTAPGFYAPQGRSVNTPAKLENFIDLLGKTSFMGDPITNIEMETAGIYGLADLLGHQAISISAILANRSTGEFSDKPEKIVEQLISNALELIVEL